ncbi:MAG: FHA domain-containing protein [Gemmatimonadaceae bacterium]
MVRIIIRHISGSRATEVDVIPLGAHRELILGRAASAAVRFDPHADGSVGRHHARIGWTDEQPTHFVLSDLGSRNGTFVNGRRIIHPVVLEAGDRVQLGTHGPEVEVKWELTAAVPAR